MIDHKPGHLTDDQSKALQDLAHQTVRLLEIRNENAKLREASIRLADTVECISDSYLALDKDWIITEVNENHVRATKIPREQQIGKSFIDLYFASAEVRKSKYWTMYNEALQTGIGKPLIEAFPEIEHTFIPQLLKSVYETGVPVHKKEFRIELENVNNQLCEFYLNFSYDPLRDSEGKIYGIAATATDVTKLVQDRKTLARRCLGRGSFFRGRCG